MSEVEISLAELERIKAAGRCEACGHLNTEHNFHCCQYCCVPDCPCEWGEMPEQREEARRKWAEEEAKRDKSNDGPSYETGVCVSEPFERVV